MNVLNNIQVLGGMFFSCQNRGHTEEWDNLRIYLLVITTLFTMSEFQPMHV